MVEQYQDYPLIDRVDAVELFYDLCRRESSIHFLGLTGDSKLGKSRLLREYAHIATNELNAFTAFIDFREGEIITKNFIMSSIGEQIELDKFKNYKKTLASNNAVSVSLKKIIQSSSLIQVNVDNTTGVNDVLQEKLEAAFIKDLNELKKTGKITILIFDTIDEASNSIRLWLINDLFQRICKFKNLRIVFAGRTLSPTLSSLQNLTKTHGLNPVVEIGLYKKFCEEINLSIDENFLINVCSMFDGIPGLFADYVPKLLRK